MMGYALALDRFDRVSLEELEMRAELLDRSEFKYLVRAPDLASMTDELARHFDALEIDGLSVFTYETTYFDTDDLLTYHQHAQGKRRRLKIRSRRYVDSGMCFFEVKLKGARGRTLKERLAYDEFRHGSIDDNALRFLDECVRHTYGEPFARPMKPALTMQYRRVTLVGRGSPERVTIDFDLNFTRPGGLTVAAPPDVCIIEVKSARGIGRADRTLREAGHRGASCSKYCVGLNLTLPELRYNRFKPVLTQHFGWTSPDTGDLQSDIVDYDDATRQVIDEFGHVIELLTSEFDHLGHAAVVAVVLAEVERFARAPVRGYLGILVHRNAREQLRNG